MRAAGPHSLAHSPRNAVLEHAGTCEQYVGPDGYCTRGEDERQGLFIGG